MFDGSDKTIWNSMASAPMDRYFLLRRRLPCFTAKNEWKISCPVVVRWVNDEYGGGWASPKWAPGTRHPEPWIIRNHDLRDADWTDLPHWEE